MQEFQEYPKTLYAQASETVVEKVVQSRDEERAARTGGTWHLSPVALAAALKKQKAS